MRALQVFALFSAACAIALLAAEGILRWIGYSNPSFHVADADLGFGLRPGAEGLWTEEGRAYVKINSDGLRDVEHSVAKPDGTIRIAVLGDSYAEGRQLPVEDLFWKVAEREVSKCLPDDRTVEVLNFGVSGYGTAQELVMLRTRVWKYKPDIVLLAFVTGNDIRNNSKALNDNVRQPYFVLEGGRLVLDNSFLHSEGFDTDPGWLVGLGRRFVNDSRLLQLINRVRFQRFIEPRMRVQQVGAKTAGEVGLDDNIYSPPKTDTWTEAWEVTEALVQTMAAEVQAAGARFLLVILSNSSQVNPNADARQSFMTQLGIEELFYPDQRILNLARRSEIHAIALAPALQMWAQEHNTCVHGFPNSGVCSGHWNRHGHQLAGEWVARTICRSLSSSASAGGSVPDHVLRNGGAVSVTSK